MDSKDRYSAGVKTQNILSNQNEVLRAAIERSWARRNQYWDNWQEVNINEIVQRFAPDAVPYEKGVKVHWKSPTTGYDVVADISGYVRIQDLNPGPYKGSYLDINGNHVKDIPQQAGESAEEYRDRLMRVSHFKILKKGENVIMEEAEFFVRVPDNEKANAEYLSVNMPHVKSFSFSEDEVWFLMRLFDRFNKKFGILIDLYEDDHIKPEHLSEALEMTRAFAAENAGGQFDDAIKRFSEAVELALANQAWLIFDF